MQISEEKIVLQFRQYFHKELPEIVGTSKWNLNRDLKPHRAKLGKRNGNRWKCEQVELILRILGIPYIVVK